MTLVGELYEEIDQNPPAIEARKILITTFIDCGYTDTLREAIFELRSLVKNDPEVEHWFNAFCKPLTKDTTTHGRRDRNMHFAAKKHKPTLRVPETRPAALPRSKAEKEKMKSDLTEGYKVLFAKARVLFQDARVLSVLKKGKGKASLSTANSTTVDGNDDDHDTPFSALEHLANGCITAALNSNHARSTSIGDDSSTGPFGTASTRQAPPSARSIAKAMKSQPHKAVDTALSDLEATASWLRSPASRLTSRDDDTVREHLLKRSQAVAAGLPAALHAANATAWMHAQKELLGKKYLNSETMYGDEVGSVAREHFFASEDGYAWHMEELAAAIRAQGGVMRNPLSKNMFTPEDIQFIVQHECGRELAALGVKQRELRKGVRMRTIEEMEKLGKILLEDQTEDQVPSRKALDEFMGYMATLPEAEQKSLDRLKVPARDTHTGMAFDGTIGESVRDAKANRVCIHKTGECSFLSISPTSVFGHVSSKYSYSAVLATSLRCVQCT